MIAALLTLIGFFIAIYEKIELFRKPVTFIKISIIILLAASAIISFIKDVNNDYEQAHNTKVIDSLNTKANIQTDQITYLRKESKKAQKEYVDSIVNYHNYTTELLAQYGLKVDNFENVIKKFDTSSHKEIQPTLTILEVPAFTKNNNENLISYTLTALNADVHLLGYYYTYVNTKNILNNQALKFIDSPVISPGSANFTTIIPVGRPYEPSIFIDRIEKNTSLTDTFFVAMEFIYKSKDNKTQTPLRKVYKVALYLKKYKIWKKFYYL